MMSALSNSYKLRQCSKCLGNFEYYCASCPCDLCPQCNENHMNDQETLDHNVMIYAEKYSYIPKQEFCLRHPHNVYEMYCKPCERPVCNYCTEPEAHKKISLIKAYEREKQLHSRTINVIKREALFHRHALIAEIQDDAKTCHTEFKKYHSKTINTAKSLKKILKKKLNCIDLKHRCSNQKKEVYKQCTSIQNYVHRYEQSSETPIKFLQFIKRNRVSQISKATDHRQHSLLSTTQEFNDGEVMKLLNKLHLKENGKRNECLLKLMPSPEFHRSLTVVGVDRCVHISQSTSDQISVSDGVNIILTKKGHEPIQPIISDGVHTLTQKKELIYIDKDYNIRKNSNNMNTAAKIIERTDEIWIPLCVYSSLSTKNLLVGMVKQDLSIGKLVWYNKIGQETKTVQYNSKGIELFKMPNYITENNNGDIVVSDSNRCGSGAVVVTTENGKHRFSYRGNPSGSELQPRGITTDALSHILVCDRRTFTVQMIDSNGVFLLNLLIRPSGIFSPCSLSYEVKTHRLWVGSEYNNKLCVYRYLTRENTCNGKF